MSEIFARTEILLKSEGLAKLQKAHIFVAGVGGVGSYTVESLARAGIGRFTLIDSDTVMESNINRQLIALQSTLGRPKAEVMRDRVLDINPNCKVVAHNCILDKTNASEFLSDPTIDFVADAIDSLGCKTAFLREAVKRNLPVISSLGAGRKLDITKIQIELLSKTKICPLARRVRIELAKTGEDKKIMSIFSTEPPSEHGVKEETTQGRSRVSNGTISYMTAAFGLYQASYIINHLLNKDQKEE